MDNLNCKNSSVNDYFKEILEHSRQLQLAIDVHYVPFRDNIADAPSYTCSELDCMLSEKAWKSVEHRFGPHSFDLMALDSNCRRDRSGLKLPYYSPWPTPASEGVNAFSQPIPLEHNIYAFLFYSARYGSIFWIRDSKGPLLWWSQICVPGIFGELSFSLSWFIAFCLAGRAMMLYCFSPLAPRMSGQRDVFSGTCGLIAVFSNL